MNTMSIYINNIVSIQFAVENGCSQIIIYLIFHIFQSFNISIMVFNAVKPLIICYKHMSMGKLCWHDDQYLTPHVLYYRILITMSAWEDCKWEQKNCVHSSESIQCVTINNNTEKTICNTNNCCLVQKWVIWHDQLDNLLSIN